ncbi:hypothetical protein JCM33374_g4964 [Metschnikowia sp. JCM 33374]|nr:hypothetical protein JCM33374_g4964 [Metschnikowia sp. JCM 33374]
MWVYFSTKELAYLDAWFHIIRSIRPNTKAAKAKALNWLFTEFINSVDSTIEPEVLPEPFGPQTSPSTYSVPIAKDPTCQKNENLVSKSIHSFSLSPPTYEKFWEHLKKIFFHHQHFTYIHLFHLGRRCQDV